MSWVVMEQNSPLSGLVMCHTRSVTGSMPRAQKETSFIHVVEVARFCPVDWFTTMVANFINMEGISLNDINNLPLTINVYHRCYKFGGCTINTGGHFVAILLWHGTHYFYDGIRSNKQQRFIEYNHGLLANLRSKLYWFLCIIELSMQKRLL